MGRLRGCLPGPHFQGPHHPRLHHGCPGRPEAWCSSHGSPCSAAPQSTSTCSRAATSPSRPQPTSTARSSPRWIISRSATVTSVVAIMLVLMFFISGADANTYVLSMMTSHGSLTPRCSVLILWGALTGITAVVLMLAGGLTALQNTVIVASLPFLVIIAGPGGVVLEGADRRQRAPIRDALAQFIAQPPITRSPEVKEHNAMPDNDDRPAPRNSSNHGRLPWDRGDVDVFDGLMGPDYRRIGSTGPGPRPGGVQGIDRCHPLRVPRLAHRDRRDRGRRG